MYSFYTILDQDLNKDGYVDNLIAKYNDTKFLGFIPMKKRVTKIDNELFITPPKLPKNAIYYITKKDINRDGVKDYILSVFTNKGKLLFGVPLPTDGLIKRGGDTDMGMIMGNDVNIQGLTPKQREAVLVAQVENLKAQTERIKDETGFLNRAKGSFADSAGSASAYVLGYGLVSGMSALFSE